MTFKERLKGVGIALIITVVCIPISIVVTIFTSPFWSWFEKQFGIESLGHSGPAGWCYLVSYAFFVVICTFLGSFAKRR